MMLPRSACVLLLACALLLPDMGSAAPQGAPVATHHFALLEQALLKYRELANQPALTHLTPLPGHAIRPGDNYADAAALRKLLAAVGDLPAALAGNDGSASVLDPALAVALTRFQERHGLEQDGILGPATWRALTTPMTVRVRQIEYTLARWRSLPANPRQRAIFINIPRFRLYAMNGADDRETAMLQMDVVVGRAIEKLRTPAFSADLTHIVFRPYWDVPRSIALGEILPEMRKNPGYLAASNFELVDGQGRPASPRDEVAALEGGAVRVRQRPGAGNALGAVKFMLPNSHNVYLHDTPDRQLFSRAMRAFSHGCIRVSAPAALAQWLLDGHPTWTPERIADAMNSKQPLQVDLAEAVRVYIVYGTAIAREDGSVLFLPDVYGLDRDWRGSTSPGAHTSRIEMDKIRRGVEAHTPQLQADGQLAQSPAADT
jgi:murein L,D-transpeptidase YcbB/YkuD